MSRLYLVDDHPIVREGLRGVLEQAGHVVVGEASDPVTALDGIRRLAPDIAIVDVHLGGRSGLDLVTEVGERAPGVRCIVLTMSSQARHVGEALRSGAAGYILKGSAASVLLQAIADVTAGRTHLGPDVADLAVTGLTSDSGDGSLSRRERQIVELVVRGHSSVAIGEQLNLSPKTVETYRSRTMAKLGLTDTPALVRWAVRQGLVDLDE